MEEQILTAEEQVLADDLELERPVRKAAVTGTQKPIDKPIDGKRTANVIRGELVGSRGFSVARMVNAIYAKNWNEAKLENEVHEVLRSLGYKTRERGRLIPTDSRYLVRVHPEFARIGLDEAMAEGYEPSETMAKKILRYNALRERSIQFAMGQNVLADGGFLISPEVSADIITLMRANAVMEAAGARVVTLPDSGELDIPKQTGGGTGYHVGEFEALTESQLKFGLLQLRAKYAAVLMAASNRSLQHSEGVLESLLREDMAATLQLTQDLAMIQAVGSTSTPRGLINWPDIQKDNINGAIKAEDLIEIEEKAMSKNARGPFAWIFNTKVRSKIRQLRSGMLKSDDTPDYTTGSFVFMRELVDGDFRDTLLGYPVHISTQIPVSTGNKTYLVFGQFSEAIIGREPVMEIAASEHVGFLNDVTYFKAISGYDFGLRTEDVFVYAYNIAV